MTTPTLALPADPAAPSRLRRFACMMYEGVLLFAVVFLASYLFDTLTQSRHGLMLRHARQGWLFVCIGFYFLLCWRKGGQTLPMKTWHIRLVDLHGQVPALPRLALRYLLAWVLPLAAAAAVWTLAMATGWPASTSLVVFAPFANFLGTFAGGGQFLHDRLAGTRLVDHRP
ncbi:RDD family protein [Orrella sp. JC864]|uniref:RDD family protein n=1 Tax=Orrella sp. JC864 TaxID=3120298 RepID=UPI0012BD1C4D